MWRIRKIYLKGGYRLPGRGCKSPYEACALHGLWKTSGLSDAGPDRKVFLLRE